VNSDDERPREEVPKQTEEPKFLLGLPLMTRALIALVLCIVVFGGFSAYLREADLPAKQILK
jgi:hypothetical protein